FLARRFEADLQDSGNLTGGCLTLNDQRCYFQEMLRLVLEVIHLHVRLEVVLRGKKILKNQFTFLRKIMIAC
ncbi:uncharacterized protein METZ01_LOCUS505600, partial [marine metagenome]